MKLILLSQNIIYDCTEDNESTVSRTLQDTLKRTVKINLTFYLKNNEKKPF